MIRINIVTAALVIFSVCSIFVADGYARNLNLTTTPSLLSIGSDRYVITSIGADVIYTSAPDDMSGLTLNWKFNGGTPATGSNNGPLTVIYDESSVGSLQNVNFSTSRTSSGKTCATNNALAAKVAVIPIKRAPASGSSPGTYQVISTTNSNTDVLPGQKIYLKCDVPSTFTVTTYEWVLPGVVFKDYDPTKSSAQLTNLASSDKNSSTVAFYWADTGDNREVKCNITVDGGSTYTIKSKLNVKAPTSTLSASGQNPSLNSAKTLLGMFSKSTPFGSTAGGIVFNGGVTVPSGFSEGSWCYAQVVSAAIDGTASGGAFHNTNRAQALDAFPYLGSGDIYSTPNNNDTSDSPGAPLQSITSITLDYSFIMYIMFKPSGDGSQYVPLRSISWRMRASAAITGGNWALTGTNSLTPSPLVAQGTTTHPQWTGNVLPVQY